MAEEIIDGEVTDLAVVVEKPVMPIEDLVGHVDYIHDIQNKVMIEDQHYGIIPGCEKPSLLKPGADELCVACQMRPDPTVTHATREDDFIFYEVRCDLYHIPTGKMVGSGVGSCNSREKKYKKNDPWNIANTILKMAKKRALVDAVLTSTAASDIFTQDVEDMQDIVNEENAPTKSDEKATKKQIDFIKSLTKEYTKEQKEDVLSVYQASKLEDLSKWQAKDCIENLVAANAK